MLLRNLHLWHRLLLYAALANLVIIIILHVIGLHDLVWLVTLWRLLFQILVLNICIFDNYLLAFLLDYLLLRLWLHLRWYIQLLISMRASEPILLHGNSLLLFRRTPVTLFITILVVEQTFKSLDELCFLIFYLFFVCVTRKVNIFALACFLESRAGSTLSVLISWIKWLLFIKLIETRTVFFILHFWNIRRFLTSYLVPVKSSEKWMILNLLNAIWA